MELRIITRGPYDTLSTPNRGWRGASTGLYLHNDRPWYCAPIPWRLHRCRPCSVGIYGAGVIREMIFRCACGGIMKTDDFKAWHSTGWAPGKDLIWDREATSWKQRNTRRRNRHSFATLM